METVTPELELTPMPAPEPEPEALAADAPPDALGGLVLHDPTALAAQLETYSQTRGMLVDWLFNHLVAGTDYMLIHRKRRGEPCSKRGDAASSRCPECGGKATLCKPGSEKLCGLLRLRPRFSRDDETWQMLGATPGVLAYKCELVTAGGTVVAEGRGARAITLDGDDVNKTIKMAAKSAQTDAVLRCAGLSEIFTQDLEDIPAGVDAEAAEPFGTPGRKSERPAPEPDVIYPLKRSVEAAASANATPPPASGDGPRPDDALSRARVNRLLALVHEAVRAHDVPDTEHEAVFDRARGNLTAWVATTSGRSRLDFCSYRVYDELCAQVGPAVAAALAGPRRPQMRLVWRDKQTGRVLQ